MGQNAPEDNSEHADMTEYYGHLYNQSVARGLKSLIYAIQFLHKLNIKTQIKAILLFMGYSHFSIPNHICLQWFY